MAVRMQDVSDLSRTQWLKLRQKGIGGSDVAAICGLSRWKSPMHVYLDKTEPLQEHEQSEAAYWGTVMEEILAQEFARRMGNGYEVVELKKLLIHPEHDWAFANLDRVIVNVIDDDEGILECKTASEFLHHEWKDNAIPEYYMTQIQWYFAVTGKRWGYFATLVGGNKFYSIPVERDDRVIEYLINLCGDFWHNNVLKRIPPSFDGSEASTELVKRMFPVGEDADVVHLSDDVTPIVEQLYKAEADKKDADRREAEAKNQLKAIMGTAALAVHGGKLAFTWKNQDDTRLDSKALARDHPDLYARYMNKKQIRKFLLK